jgi:hypothetical protein
MGECKGGRHLLTRTSTATHITVGDDQLSFCRGICVVCCSRLSCRRGHGVCSTSSTFHEAQPSPPKPPPPRVSELSKQQWAYAFVRSSKEEDTCTAPKLKASGSYKEQAYAFRKCAREL